MSKSISSHYYYVGVDVGTGSARAGLFNDNGELLSLYKEEIEVHNPKIDCYEQSSEEIWSKVCSCVKFVSSVIEDKSLIKGIGFDATCSLVVLDQKQKPLNISVRPNETCYDIIMWMDHRAKEETEFINSQNHEILMHVGGNVSIEMQMPKLLWIKNHLPETYKAAGHFFDLSDFLTFKATGNTTRSLCSLVSKWNYYLDKENGHWDDKYLESISLSDLSQDNYAKIGNKALCPGEFCGNLCQSAADAMNLSTNTVVATSLIDAHAGGLSLLSSQIPPNIKSIGTTGMMGLICGTSTCHMCISENAVFAPGVWGPFYNAMIPGMWLNEGGQSATGSLVDHIIKSHSSSQQIKTCTYSYLEEKLLLMKSGQNLSNLSYLTKDLHIYPDFHGNRSPMADPSYKGMICGLTLDNSEDMLAKLYLSTLQAIAYGTKDIMERLSSYGYKFSLVLMCGGLAKSKLFVQLHADIIGLPALIPHNPESVLLGSAILGAVAATGLPMLKVSSMMGSSVDVIIPEEEVERFHGKKYKIFKEMQKNGKYYQNIMESTTI